MIRVQQLRKSFRDGDHRHTVLDGLDLQVEDGVFLALVGRSGSGKSTLLHCLAGIETPDSGQIHLDGTEITGLDDASRTRLRRDHIGIVFQFFNLLPMLSALENVALPGLLRGGRRSEVFERARQLLSELDLDARIQARPGELSGGEQQRVATARALINEPSLLLADEPTGNLDAESAERTLALLREIKSRYAVTVLMVTHSAEAAAAADAVATLRAGRIERDAAVDAEAGPTPEAADATVTAGGTPPAAEPAESETTAEDAADEAAAGPKVRPSAKAALLMKAKTGTAETDVAETDAAETDAADETDVVDEGDAVPAPGAETSGTEDTAPAGDSSPETEDPVPRPDAET